jgi:hypothetical protein
MGTISRAAKSASGTGDYTTGPIIASEVNADLNTVYDEINGNLDSSNLAANAVGTSALQNSAVTTAKIADSNVTTAKLADKAVTTSKIAVGDTVRGVLYTSVTTGIFVINSTTETTLATFGSFTSGGGWIEFGGAWTVQLSPQPSSISYYLIRLYRDSTVIQTLRVNPNSASSSNDAVAPIPSWIERPGTGSYIYKVTAQLVASPGAIGAIYTPAANAGTLWLRETA